MAVFLLIGYLSAIIQINAAEKETGKILMNDLRGALDKGEKNLKIVCFGDSITGVYYHTGGKRAWGDMLRIALNKLYPNAKLELYNAGISGNTTEKGLKRIDRDVLALKPQLVVVMFGMNDCAKNTPQVFHDNLKKIVQKCFDAGSAVVLCTQNSIYPEDVRRSKTLGTYAEVIHTVAMEMSVPLADCYHACEDLRTTNPGAWKLLMSETIHPNMNGHRLFAEVIAGTISGKKINLNGVPPPSPGMSFTFEKLSRKQSINFIAMPPCDTIIPAALKKLYPDAVINVTLWPCGQLNELELWSKDIRGKKPDLVAIAVPAEIQGKNDENFIRSYNWILNWSIPLGKAEWDIVAVLPSVINPHLSAVELDRENLARQIIIGKDIGFIERKDGDESGTAELILHWIHSQHKVWYETRKQ